MLLYIYPRPPVVPSEKVGLGWVWRVQIPFEEVLGGVGIDNIYIYREREVIERLDPQNGGLGKEW